MVLQFLIDHAKLIFADEEPQGTPSSVRFSVGSQITTGSCTSPADNMSQTSSVQLVHFAGIRAQRRNVNRLSFHDSAAGTGTLLIISKSYIFRFLVQNLKKQRQHISVVGTTLFLTIAIGRYTFYHICGIAVCNETKSTSL